MSFFDRMSSFDRILTVCVFVIATLFILVVIDKARERSLYDARLRQAVITECEHIEGYGPYLACERAVTAREREVQRRQ